jgi:hypothetical protein
VNIGGRGLVDVLEQAVQEPPMKMTIGMLLAVATLFSSSSCLVRVRPLWPPPHADRHWHHGSEHEHGR